MKTGRARNEMDKPEGIINEWLIDTRRTQAADMLQSASDNSAPSRYRRVTKQTRRPALTQEKSRCRYGFGVSRQRLALGRAKPLRPTPQTLPVHHLTPGTRTSPKAVTACGAGNGPLVAAYVSDKQPS
jgi:hypothetical protein